MTLPPDSGAPSEGSPNDADRQPLTRREARAARERAERESSAVGTDLATTPGPDGTASPILEESTTSVPSSPEPPHSAPEESFWEALTGGVATVDAPAAPQETVETASTPTMRARSSVNYPTDRARSKGPAGATSRRSPKRKRRWMVATIVTVVILALVGGGALFVWNTFQPQVQALIAMTQPNDYTGGGTTPVDVTIKSGDSGGNVADTLQKAGVVKTSDAFYTLLLHTAPAPVFQPGVYQVKKQMSAKAALAAIQNPKNKLQHTLVITEGDTEASILPALATATGVSLSDLQAAAATPTDFGLPSQARNLEGYLFPATYTFSPGMTAKAAITTLVDRTNQAFEADGVPAADRWNTIILASIVQKEAGSDADMGKVARVFTNRMSQGMNLQSDATVAYGAGVKTVFTTDAERADASNPYNTYVHPGLPVGPISNPGDAAIKAAMNPTPGSWLYFVAVNLQTGETVFSDTYAEQQAAQQQLQNWCNASSANDAYCQ